MTTDTAARRFTPERTDLAGVPGILVWPGAVRTVALPCPLLRAEDGGCTTPGGPRPSGRDTSMAAARNACGPGKSTTIGMLVTTVVPTSGHAYVAGDQRPPACKGAASAITRARARLTPRPAPTTITNPGRYPAEALRQELIGPLRYVRGAALADTGKPRQSPCPPALRQVRDKRL